MQIDERPVSTRLRLVQVAASRNWCTLLIGIGSFALFLLMLADIPALGSTIGLRFVAAESTPLPACQSNTVLVLVAHDREEYFRQTLSSLAQARRLDDVCVLLSVDNADFLQTAEAIAVELLPSIQLLPTILHERPTTTQPWSSDDAITWHHRQIFNAIFVKKSFEFGIVVETDLVLSPDFIEFMLAGRQYLDDEESQLFCISGWNDNGFDNLLLREDRLFRTDFFPGLGWMLKRESWTNWLAEDWPKHAGYDWWLRDKTTARNKHCIAPEVSRTHHVSKYGSHVNGNGYVLYDRMVLSGGAVPIPVEEWEVVSRKKSFEERIRGETVRRKHRLYKNDANALFTGLRTLREGNVVGMFNKAQMPHILARLGLYPDRLRAGYEGLLTVRVKDTNNQITLIYDHQFPTHFRNSST